MSYHRTRPLVTGSSPGVGVGEGVTVGVGVGFGVGVGLGVDEGLGVGMGGGVDVVVCVGVGVTVGVGVGVAVGVGVGICGGADATVESNSTPWVPLCTVIAVMPGVSVSLLRLAPLFVGLAARAFDSINRQKITIPSTVKTFIVFLFTIIPSVFGYLLPNNRLKFYSLHY
jgi:hypothetical protein